MADIAAAMQMLDTFTSVGAESFVVTKTELEWPGHKKVKWGKTYLDGRSRVTSLRGFSVPFLPRPQQ